MMMRREEDRLKQPHLSVTLRRSQRRERKIDWSSLTCSIRCEGVLGKRKIDWSSAHLAPVAVKESWDEQSAIYCLLWCDATEAISHIWIYWEKSKDERSRAIEIQFVVTVYKRFQVNMYDRVEFERSRPVASYPTFYFLSNRFNVEFDLFRSRV